MTNGTIKTIANQDGGVIHPDWGRDDLGFQRGALEGIRFEHLRQGDMVTYTAEADSLGTGWHAVRIRPRPR